MRADRWKQWLTGLHEIHHIRWGYGRTFILFPWLGWFVQHGLRWINPNHYHNCTITGVY